MQIIFLTKGRIKLRLRMGTTFDILGTQKTSGKNYLSKTVDFYHKGLKKVKSLKSLKTTYELNVTQLRQ